MDGKTEDVVKDEPLAPTEMEGDEDCEACNI